MRATIDWRGLCEELLKVVTESDDYIMREGSTVALVARARAALAQPEPEGRPAPAPAEGELAELVWELRQEADLQEVYYTSPEVLHRAADLLEQRHSAPVPVPVSERLPGPEDCDAEGRCWWGLEESDDYEACWTLRKMHGIPFDNTRWLPATALPLPQGEVRP